MRLSNNQESSVNLSPDSAGSEWGLCSSVKATICGWESRYSRALTRSEDLTLNRHDKVCSKVQLESKLSLSCTTFLWTLPQIYFQYYQPGVFTVPRFNYCNSLFDTSSEIKTWYPLVITSYCHTWACRSVFQYTACLCLAWLSSALS